MSGGPVVRGGRRMGAARRYGLYVAARIWYTAWNNRNRQILPAQRTGHWAGHRDLCPIQWGDPCDCDLPPRTTPCTCHYWTEAYDLRVSISDPVAAHQYVWPPAVCSGFTINPRCHHHGDQAQARTPHQRPCYCIVFGPHPDCPRHNYDPTEDEPDPAHDNPPNPYDLDEDERHA